VRGLGQHVLNHDAKLSVEVIGYVDVVVLAVDDFAINVDDLDGSVWLLDCARSVPVLGHDRAIHQDLDDFRSRPLQLAYLAQLLLADVKVEHADGSLAVT